MSRALVLGGGGVTGIGWEVGVLAGLLDEGVDLRGADAVIGTSAGSFVGANYASFIDWDAVFGAQGRAGESEPVMRPDPAVYAAWVEAFRAGGNDRETTGVGFGRVARQFPADEVGLRVRRRAVRGRLFTQIWAPSLRVTVTDAETGELRLLGPDSGFDLETATMASGAVPGVWPPVTANGRVWIDAGMVSPANAHLAQGFDRVVVLAPMTSSGPGAPRGEDDVARLGERVPAVLVAPDEASLTAFGANPYDPSRAGAAAGAGRRQGRAWAGRVAGVW